MKGKEKCPFQFEETNARSLHEHYYLNGGSPVNEALNMLITLGQYIPIVSESHHGILRIKHAVSAINASPFNK